MTIFENSDCGDPPFAAKPNVKVRPSNSHSIPTTCDNGVTYSSGFRKMLNPTTSATESGSAIAEGSPHYELPLRSSYQSDSRTGRQRKAGPRTSKKQTEGTVKATAAARKHGIPPGYSLKNWDPLEEPIMLLGSVFDANSLGKWIYDWTVYRHGLVTPMADMAGEFLLLLAQLAGKVKRAEECMLFIPKVEDREMVEDFVESGERLTDKLKKILKACETPMLKAGKNPEKDSAQLGKDAGTEFVDSFFGRDKQLEQTERFMNSVRLWNLRFDANCADILRRHPGRNSETTAQGMISGMGHYAIQDADTPPRQSQETNHIGYWPVADLRPQKEPLNLASTKEPFLGNQEREKFETPRSEVSSRPERRINTHLPSSISSTPLGSVPSFGQKLKHRPGVGPEASLPMFIRKTSQRKHRAALPPKNIEVDKSAMSSSTFTGNEVGFRRSKADDECPTQFSNYISPLATANEIDNNCESQTHPATRGHHKDKNDGSKASFTHPTGTLESVSDGPYAHEPQNQCGSSSDISASTELSLDFETDSVRSSDGTDCEDGQAPTVMDILDVLRDEPNLRNSRKSEKLIAPSLNSMKRGLIDGIMKDFWVVFDQEWSANMRTCTGTPGSSSSTSSISGPGFSLGTFTTNKQKRSRDDGQDGSPGKDDDENQMPPRKVSSQFGHRAEERKFACPYRKHNPQKYSCHSGKWRLCAVNSFDSIARLKAHLYRTHRIFKCERCNELFKDSDTLKSHFMATKACDLRQTDPIDGITCDVEKKLKIRKKTHKNQSPGERWKEIYSIIFPMELVPEPYFEIINENDTRSSSSLEEFSRQELPRLFRSALEAAVNDEVQPIEERLRDQLLSMIRECQDRVFSNYRAIASENVATPQFSETTHTSLDIPAGQINLNVQEVDVGGAIRTSYRPPLDAGMHQPALNLAIQTGESSRPLGQSNFIEPDSLRDFSGWVGASEVLDMTLSHSMTPHAPQPITSNTNFSQPGDATMPPAESDLSSEFQYHSPRISESAWIQGTTDYALQHSYEQLADLDFGAPYV